VHKALEDLAVVRCEQADKFVDDDELPERSRQVEQFQV
jgi:hypothetical protein